MSRATEYNKLRKCVSEECKNSMFLSLSIISPSNDEWEISCNICGVKTDLIKDHSKALSAWNKGKVK